METNTCTVETIAAQFIARLVTVAAVASCCVDTLLFTFVCGRRCTFIHIYKNLNKPSGMFPKVTTKYTTKNQFVIFKFKRVWKKSRNMQITS